jgi:hypothetical protein
MSVIERVALAFTGLHVTTASGIVVDHEALAWAAIDMLRDCDAMRLGEPVDTLDFIRDLERAFDRAWPEYRA